MANWKYRLDIRGIWANDELDISQKGKMIAREIKRIFPESWFDFASDDYDSALDDIVEAFDNITGYDDVSDVEEFDEWMDVLYDYADQEIAPYGKFPVNRMMWVMTK